MNDDFRRLGEIDTVKAMSFTPKDKLQCAARELAMRRNVYPKWIASGKMKQAAADREISIMESIVADLRMDVARLDQSTDHLAAALRDMGRAMTNPAFAQLCEIAADRIDHQSP